MCISPVCVVFIQVLWFPSTGQINAGRIASAKLPLGMKECVNGAWQWTGIPSVVNVPT